MYNVGITTTKVTTPVDILFCTDNAVSVSIIVKQDSGTDTNNVVKAGTPMKGDLKDRTKQFEKDSTGDETVGILLHDVDVTKGDNNGTLLLTGFVNLDRVDETTAQLITENVETALKGNIIFLKDN